MDFNEYSERLLSGDRYASLTGIKVDQVREHYAKCSIEVENKHLNVHDAVMGGAIFTLADFAFGMAVNTAKGGCVTLSSSINFLRPATGSMLYAEAQCTKDGVNICFCNVTITDEKDNLIAQAQFNGFRAKHDK